MSMLTKPSTQMPAGICLKDEWLVFKNRPDYEHASCLSIRKPLNNASSKNTTLMPKANAVFCGHIHTLVTKSSYRQRKGIPHVVDASWNEILARS